MSEERKQHQNVGSGVAAADQQQRHRRPDQRERHQQDQADAAAARARLAAIDGGRPMCFAHVARCHDELEFRPRYDVTLPPPWCLTEGGSRKGFAAAIPCPPSSIASGGQSRAAAS